MAAKYENQCPTCGRKLDAQGAPAPDVTPVSADRLDGHAEAVRTELDLFLRKLPIVDALEFEDERNQVRAELAKEMTTVVASSKALNRIVNDLMAREQRKADERRRREYYATGAGIV